MAKNPKAQPERRRRRSLSIRYGALFLAVAVLLAWFVPVLPVDRDELTVTIGQGGGTVVSADGSTSELTVGTVARPGDRIVTPAGSSVTFEAADGHSFTATDSAHLVVGESRETLLGRGIRSEVELERGEVRVGGEGEPRTSLDIGLPHGWAGVRGTSLHASVDGSRSTLAVYEGSVSLSRIPIWGRALTPGRGAVLSAEGTITKSVPAAPQIRPLSEGTRSSTRGPR